MENIKLEAGKFYRAEGGAKIYIASALPNPFIDGDTYPFIGYVNGEYVDKTFFWNASGVCYTERKFNIVAEWVEPKRIKGWVNIVAKNPENPSSSHVGRLTCVWPTREMADAYCAYDRLACIEIDVLEGQGLDGSAR